MGMHKDGPFQSQFPAVSLRGNHLTIEDGYSPEYAVVLPRRLLFPLPGQECAEWRGMGKKKTTSVLQEK